MKRKSLAIPIRCNDFSNSSQVVSLFSPEHGLVEGIVKGAHRTKNAFQGPFDLAVLREVVFVERRSPGLSIITESEILEGYRGLRKSWKRFVAGSHVIELLRAVVVAGEPAVELFDLTADTLFRIAYASLHEVSDRLLYFEARALRLLGFLGAIDACVLCRRPWPGTRRAAFFSPRVGGLVCRQCHDGRGDHGPVTALPGHSVRALQTFASERRMPEDDALRGIASRQLHQVLFQSCTFFLERPLEMLKYSAVWL